MSTEPTNKEDAYKLVDEILNNDDVYVSDEIDYELVEGSYIPMHYRVILTRSFTDAEKAEQAKKQNDSK